MFDTIRQKVLTAEDLNDIRTRHRENTIVFCSGCYDILQSGHPVFFNQCKQYGDVLVVGVGRDSVITQLKGPSRPVNPENNRLYLVAALQDVDYTVLNDTRIEAGKIDFRIILENLRPDIFVLNDDDSAMNEKKALCDRLGIRLQTVSREVPPELEATSSSGIIDKITFSYKAPLRIDFAGGWTDVPYIMNNAKGCVTNLAITPYIEYREGAFNFSGYPRGSGLSTSTAAKLLQLISARDYNTDARSCSRIAEDLFTMENKDLNWAIGRQDQYAIVFGGINCFEFGSDYGKVCGPRIDAETVEEFVSRLVLIHTGASRNAQTVVKQVYDNHTSDAGREALNTLVACGYEFAQALAGREYQRCAQIMERNFAAQKQLAPATSSDYLERMYAFAKQHGAYGGKICGAGGGGAFVFVCDDPRALGSAMEKEFQDSFPIPFGICDTDIKTLNRV